MKYFKPNSKRAIRLAIAIKGLTATLAAMSFINQNPKQMFVIMIIGAISNETINFLSGDEKHASVNKSGKEEEDV